MLKNKYVFYNKTEICLLKFVFCEVNLCFVESNLCFQICVLSNSCFENRSNLERQICVSTKDKFAF